MADIANALAKFNPNDKYDPGKIVIFFDARTERSSEDKFSTLQRYWTEGLYRLGWPSFYTPDLDPGMLRLVWYTVSVPKDPYMIPSTSLDFSGLYSIISAWMHH